MKELLFLVMIVLMDALQNLTRASNAPEETQTNANGDSEQELLKPQQLLYIDFVAVGGLITEEDGNVIVMRATQFAQKIQVSRQTLYDWQKNIPNFWDRVATRRKELGGNSRIQQVWNGVYLKARTGNPQAAALWLANFDPNFRMPAQKVEHGLDGGIADLLNKARERRRSIEGEVVESKTNT